MIQVQILHEAVRISFSGDASAKDINPEISMDVESGAMKCKFLERVKQI